MLKRSLTFAILLLAAAGLWQCARVGEQSLGAKSSAVTPPSRDILRVAEKPTRSGLMPVPRKIVFYRMQVLQTVTYVGSGPISPLQALAELKEAGIVQYTTRYFAGLGTSIQSINGLADPDSWIIFAVNDWLPDDPDSWITRLGAFPVSRPADLDQIVGFTRGTLGVMSATAHITPTVQISPETLFSLASGQNQIRITFFRVRTRALDQ